MSENYFSELYNINMRDKIKQKNGLSYLSWAAAWAEVKKKFPDSTFNIYEQSFDITEVSKVDDKEVERIYSVERPWFDDGKTGWVKTGVVINGLEHIEDLPIMDFKNKPIPADSITSTDANKAIQRSLTKACARHGLGLYVYEGEDLPEEDKKILELRAACLDLVIKKSGLSEATKQKVMSVCKASGAETAADIQVIDNLAILEKLHTDLLAIRKIVDKKQEANKKA